jgi:WD40 repeat protein
MEARASLKGIDFSPDNTTMATGRTDRIIRLWDVESGRLLAAMEGHQYPIRDLCFVGGGRTIVSRDDAGFAFWDVETREQFYFHRLDKLPYGRREVPSPPARLLDALAIAPGEDWLAVSAPGQPTQIVDLEVADAWEAF